jgi:hypothetical protein
LGTAAAPLWAAEWSITPAYSSSVDYDSNRRLAPEAKGSEATVLVVDLKLKRAVEDMELSVEPRYALRRFTDAALGNGDDRSLNAGMTWTGERATGALTASYFDQSTLTTEALETGIVTGDTHRRLSQAAATWTWNQTERRALIAQLSYMDALYRGQARSELPGYRYPAASFGEQFAFNERGSFTLSAFGSRLQSNTPGNSSHELGLRAAISYRFSERTGLEASLGESSRVLAGESGHGTDAAITLSHSLLLGKVSVSYARSLVPYGTGFLVEQQQYTAALTRALTPYLDGNLSVIRIGNNQTAVLLRLASRNYDSVGAGLTWHPAQTWSVNTQLGAVRTQLAGLTGRTINSWRSSVTLTWSAFPTSRSW